MIEKFLMIYVILSRLYELRLSSKNTKYLLTNGAKEFYPSHYKFIVIFHLIFILYFLLKPVILFESNFMLLFIFFLTQIFRYKIINDLGAFWTTRIIVNKEIPMIKSGIYRYLRHPNYIIVLTEVVIICLIFNDYIALISFTTVKIILLSVRIFFEEKANKSRRQLTD